MLTGDDSQGKEKVRHLRQAKLVRKWLAFSLIPAKQEPPISEECASIPSCLGEPANRPAANPLRGIGIRTYLAFVCPALEHGASMKKTGSL